MLLVVLVQLGDVEAIRVVDVAVPLDNGDDLQRKGRVKHTCVGRLLRGRTNLGVVLVEELRSVVADCADGQTQHGQIKTNHPPPPHPRSPPTVAKALDDEGLVDNTHGHVQLGHDLGGAQQLADAVEDTQA